VGGHRIKNEIEYGRGPEKTWVYGALRPVDGHEFTMTVARCNSAVYQQFLQVVEGAHPGEEIVVVTDNLSSHHGVVTRTWLKGHPRISQVFIPVGAAWLHLQEGWWRLYRKTALAGQSFANQDEIEAATALATAQLNARATPWVWGRPPPPHRRLRRKLTYLL
jgi:hypothetical protein